MIISDKNFVLVRLYITYFTEFTKLVCPTIHLENILQFQLLNNKTINKIKLVAMLFKR